MNNPVKYVDPSGHAPQDPGDDPNNPDPCGNDWCWQNRWYVAHGYHWSDKKQDWVLGGDPVFYDEGIIDEVLGEAGIELSDPLQASKSLWTRERKVAAARAVSLFGRALSGGTEELHRLLGNGTTDLFLEWFLPWECGDAPACSPPFPLGPGNTTFIRLDSMDDNLDRFHMVLVHELAHIIDWHSSVGGRIFSDAWQGSPLTDYASKGFLQPADRFAEAVSVYVLGVDYSKWAGPVNTAAKDYQYQMDRMRALLEGWY